MTEFFLAQLPRVAKEELSEEKACIICHEEYGTAPSDSEPAEEAVRLPCPGGHIVGSKCISSWFSSDMNRHSCPYCRTEFLAATILGDHGDRFERWLDQWHVFSSYLGGVGATPDLMQQWQQWFVQWGRAAIDVNGEAITHARTAREDLFRRTGWSEVPADTRTVCWSETESDTELEPLASAIRTLYFRESYLYVIRHPTLGFTPELLNGPPRRLSGECEASIFRRLCGKGAFRGVLDEVQSDNERWHILRSQGYVFDETRWMWSAYPY